MTRNSEFEEPPKRPEGPDHPESDDADIEAALRLQQFHLHAAIRERKLNEVAHLARELLALLPGATPDAALGAAATIWQTEEIVSQLSLLDLLKGDPAGGTDPEP